MRPDAPGEGRYEEGREDMKAADSRGPFHRSTTKKEVREESGTGEKVRDREIRVSAHRQGMRQSLWR